MGSGGECLLLVRTVGAWKSGPRDTKDLAAATLLYLCKNISWL
jgi:hypothetical protein